MIHDYTERGLVPMPDTPEARRLWSMVDPYFYRETLTLPKLLILGNNDPYWTVDALNLYWDGLQGDKWVTYVPNAGHGLVEEDEKGQPSLQRATTSLGAFTRHITAGTPMPRLQWQHDDTDGRLRVTVDARPAPVGARLWVARSLTRDFRNALWEEHKAAVKGGKVIGLVDAPKKGCLAFYAELDYESDGLPYHFSTQLRVAGQPPARR
jgi:PhoPQ-activated pathogenicity-related protein